MEITAYAHNSCNSKKPIAIKVEYLNYWENRECKHPITKENINKFLNTNYNLNKPLNISYSNTLFKGNERVFNDELVDFIHITY